MGNEVQRAVAFVGDGLDTIWALIITYSLSVVGAILLLIIGYLAAGLIERAIHAALGGIPHFDRTLRQFFATAARYGILALVLVMVLGQFGVQTASIVAAIGAAGLAIGLALQGTLQNIAAGIILLVLRPFQIGEYVEVGAVAGEIEEIGLFATRLRGVDGIYILAPNSTLWNQPVRNFDRNGRRRNDIAVTIPKDIPAADAERILLDLARQDARVLAEPQPSVLYSQVGGAAATLTLRYWTRSPDYIAAATELNQRVRAALERGALALA
ncbi:mechanosensitive ion channel [Pseudaminobacter sp. 19-2017]|uniref:Small-conductance mechanosensitive channel n=1 Tax=Pseudaminobacter soli (ex Zhang et al. 2022) TaxID=2831468 RepID=A0A942E2I6_9HYPH|nr:mechanosensitive ion channel domain-containing protein [Pseudaminobacter soli]MBS3649840.1 mechanosensitive ion channel [Pseudaminobacter soli]